MKKTFVFFVLLIAFAHLQAQLPRVIILATGHSARDIFHLLHNRKIEIYFKPFALGVRIEHPQSIIDSIQYHLPHAKAFPNPSQGGAFFLYLQKQNTDNTKTLPTYCVSSPWGRPGGAGPSYGKTFY